MKNVQNALRKVLVPLNHFVHRIVLLIAQISMMAMVAIVTLTVVLRYCFNTGLSWAEEVPRLLVTLFAFIACAIGVRDHLHVAVNAVYNQLPVGGKARKALDVLTDVVVLLCGLLVLVLLIQRPTAWPVLLALVVLWGVVVVLFRCQLRKWVARWMCGGSFEGSKLKFSLEPLSQPAALLSGETVLWYNAQFRTCLLYTSDAADE